MPTAAASSLRCRLTVVGAACVLLDGLLVRAVMVHDGSAGGDRDNDFRRQHCGSGFCTDGHDFTGGRRLRACRRTLGTGLGASGCPGGRWAGVCGALVRRAK